MNGAGDNSTHFCDGGQPYPDLYHCDGSPDCQDGSDENNCGKFIGLDTEGLAR